jgi:hypothetical protein
VIIIAKHVGSQVAGRKAVILAADHAIQFILNFNDIRKKCGVLLALA